MSNPSSKKKWFSSLPSPRTRWAPEETFSLRCFLGRLLSRHRNILFKFGPIFHERDSFVHSTFQTFSCRQLIWNLTLRALQQCTAYFESHTADTPLHIFMFTLHSQFWTSEEKYHELPRFLPYGSPFRIHLQWDDVQNVLQNVKGNHALKGKSGSRPY
jgi:hypothetical protein